MTFFEALKANETKRVKFNNDSNPWEVGELIDALNRGSLDGIVCASNQWEVVEEPLEFWVVFTKDQMPITVSTIKEQARQVSQSWSNDFPVMSLFREVPGTREEVKP
jgi:hypothetical protein